MYRHGLKIGEAADLPAMEGCELHHQVPLRATAKKGAASNQPLYGDEVRSLGQLQREYSDSSWLFTADQKAPLTTRTVRDIVNRAVDEARLR